MKRYGWLFEKAFSKENIKLAIKKSSKGKRKRRVVRRVLSNIDNEVENIYKIVWGGKYEPLECATFERKDCVSGKIRTITKPKYYPDHIIQWCIYLALYDVLTECMINNTFSSIKGRGQVAGKNAVIKKLRNKKETRYYLKIDIKKFYPSINTVKLMRMFERKIKDPKMLDIISRILRKYDGLPIGMILSQLFSNYYLYSIDQYYDKHIYFRYADDIVIFSSSKKTLHTILKSLNEDLEKLDLTMKENYQIRKTDKEMLDYMGYRMDHDKVIMRKAIMIRLNRKVLKYQKKKSYHNAAGVVSYMGFVKHSDSYKFYMDRVHPYIDFREVKDIIRKGKINENIQK